MAPRGVPLTEPPPLPRRPPPTREEYDALLARVAALEAKLAQREPPRAPATLTPYPPAVWTPPPAPQFPGQAGAPPALPARAPPAPPSAWQLPAPAAPAPPAPAKERADVESLLGQRFAPRVGAVLVFLAAVFFLGVAIQRGWIGPRAQLAIAAGFGLALVAAGEWLARSRGFGRYPQILAGTGAAVLYLTAFVSYALEHFQVLTGFTLATGGALMALVAAGTVALALRHDARAIAGMGYGLSFLTARLGFGALPVITLPYVAVLGVSLAVLVARKRWIAEGAVGSALTGAFLGAFALDAAFGDGTSPWAVLAVSAVPAGAFAWLTLRPAPDPARDGPLLALLALTTITWASFVAYWCADAAFDDPRKAGAIALALACALATGLAFAAARARAFRGVPILYGAAAVALYLLWPLRAWSDDPGALAVTAAYALGALALAAIERTDALRAKSALALAALALAAAAALHAPSQGLVVLPGDPFDGRVVGPLAAWATLALVAAPLALVAFATGDDLRRLASRAAFAGLVLFLAVWAFAVLRSAFTTTAYLLVAGLGLLAIASAAARARDHLAADAKLAATALVAFAAAKAATYDAHITAARIPLPLAALEALMVAGTLLALRHLARDRTLLREPFAGALLVGGSALVLSSYVAAYALGAWISVLLAALGVAYLATGFVLRSESVYRWTGFAALGVVLFRVFLVDLRETDLVVRAGVFAVLGAILLGVGYAYARVAKGDAPPGDARERPPGAS